LFVLTGTQFLIFRTLPSWDERLARLTNVEEELRNPAAFGKVFNISHLQGGALFRAATERLLIVAKVHQSPEGFGLQLGHFITRDEEDRPVLACDYYDKVELKFEAEGMAVSGHVPVMSVNGNCRMAADPNHLETIWIPVSSILQRESKDSEIVALGDQSLHLQFEHMPAQWPKTWVLSGIRLYHETYSDRELRMSSAQISQNLQKPMKMTWDQTDRSTF
jgi:hypothetical protein